MARVPVVVSHQVGNKPTSVGKWRKEILPFHMRRESRAELPQEPEGMLRFLISVCVGPG
jgi:hypothetical protein